MKGFVGWAQIFDFDHNHFVDNSIEREPEVGYYTICGIQFRGPFKEAIIDRPTCKRCFNMIDDKDELK
jgi:hypothetical protein